MRNSRTIDHPQHGPVVIVYGPQDETGLVSAGAMYIVDSAEMAADVASAPWTWEAAEYLDDLGVEKALDAQEYEWEK